MPKPALGTPYLTLHSRQEQATGILTGQQWNRDLAFSPLLTKPKPTTETHSRRHK